MNQKDQRLKLFVSHIHEEAALGKVVKDHLEDAFADRIAVFVSSDRRDNPGGERWLDRIERELTDPQARMLVSLVSPQSVHEPWISIELGAAWIRGHAVFPLCHSGQDVDALPRPLGDFTGAALTQQDAADRLIGAVEKAVGISAPKKWPRDDFLREMRCSAGQAVPSPANIDGHGTVTRNSAKDLTLPEEQVAILRALADLQNKGQQMLETEGMPQRCGLKPAVYSYHSAELDRRRFISIAYSMYGTYVDITPNGNGWLIAHNQMPE